MGVPIPGGMEGVASGFQPVPAGIYPASITGCEIEYASETAKYPNMPYVKVEYTITDEEYLDRKAWANYSMAPGAKPMLRQFLEAIGYGAEEIENADFEVEPEDILGRELRIALSVGTNPKTQDENNSVRRALPLDDGADGDLPS